MAGRKMYELGRVVLQIDVGKHLSLKGKKRTFVYNRLA